jgi:hypothetical protein
MNWPNGQAMTPIEHLRDRLMETRQAEAAAWAAGERQRALRLNTMAVGYRSAIVQQLAQRQPERSAA